MDEQAVRPSDESEIESAVSDDEVLVFDPERKAAAMHGSVIKLSADVKKLTDENTQLKIQLKRISGGTDINEMESLEELKKSKAEAETHLKECQVRLEGTLSRAVSAEEELNTILVRNQKLATENQTYLKESLDQGKHSKDLTTEKNRLQAKLSELEVQLNTANYSNTALKGTNDKLQSQLEQVEQECAATISKLRQERETFQQDLHHTKCTLEEKALRCKQAIHDLESHEDSKKSEIEGLHNDVALFTNKLNINEALKKQLEEALNEKETQLTRKDSEIQELKRLMGEANKIVQASRSESTEEIKSLTAARNLAEHEVVKLKTQLRSIHPMLKVDGESQAEAPFTFATIVDTKEELELTKAKLQQIQGLYKGAVESKEADAKMLGQEKNRTDQLAQRLIDTQYELSQVKSVRDAAVEWREQNQVAVDQAEDVSKTNDMLSAQLQYLLHEGRHSEDGDDELLALEYNGIKEIQQKNAELSTVINGKERDHKRELQTLQDSMQSQFNTELDQVALKMKGLEEDRDSLKKELQTSHEKCKRLAATLEECGRYKKLLSSSAVTEAESPYVSTRAPSDEESKLAIDLQNRQALTDELAAARDEVDKLKYETHEMQRQSDTIEANRQHIQSLYNHSLNNEKHLVQERDYYKMQAGISEKASDETLKMLLDSQSNLKESHVKVATLEAQQQLLKQELERLGESNKSMMESGNRIADVLTQVNGVKSFIQEHKAVSDAQVKSERDEARQTLSKREEELSSTNNTLRTQRAKHEQETTDLNAQLATAREQLATATAKFELEREQHKQQIMRNKKLAADLDISEAERKHLKQADTVEGETNYTKPTRDDIQAVQKELEEAHIENQALGTTIGGLKTALHKLEEMTRSSHSDLKSNALEIADLKGKLEQAEKKEVDRLAAFAKQSTELNERETAIKQAEAEQKAKMEELAKKNEELQRELDEGEDGRRDAQTRCLAAEDEAHSVRRSYEEAIFSKAELTKELQAMKQKEDNLPAITGGKLSIQEVDHEEVQKLKAELDKVHTALAAMEPAKCIEEKDVTAVIDCMRSRNKELEDQLRAERMESKIVRVQNDQLRLQAAVTMQNTQSEMSAKLERRIDNLKEELKETSEREENALAELKTAQSKCDEWKTAGTENTKLKEEIKQKSKEVADALVKFRTASAQMNSLKNSSVQEAAKQKLVLLAKDQEVKKAKDELITLAKDRDEKLKLKEDEKKQCLRTINAYTGQNRQLKDSKEKLENELGVIKEKMKAMDQQIENMKKTQQQDEAPAPPSTTTTTTTTTPTTAVVPPAGAAVGTKRTLSSVLDGSSDVASKVRKTAQPVPTPVPISVPTTIAPISSTPVTAPPVVVSNVTPPVVPVSEPASVTPESVFKTPEESPAEVALTSSVPSATPTGGSESPVPNRFTESSTSVATNPFARRKQSQNW
eukprot:TRINITY_DN9915_c0_g2_i6.p1 TRINITY_DN9915_c0_g2~~TRINITY_DN9915_c0_g2_i6.p1  ORF type:complete len:1433 (+),score=535.57 TRINITY_DN9915_c0_g2_i6:35-4333(+)